MHVCACIINKLQNAVYISRKCIFSIFYVEHAFLYCIIIWLAVLKMWKEYEQKEHILFFTPYLWLEQEFHQVHV